jgi:hypothetical protein
LTIVLPLWVLAGFADYLFHRATDIENNSGLRESVLHIVQFSVIGLPVTYALFFAANAGFFLLALSAILLHHIAAAIDVTYANRSRHIAPREQMVHSVLEIFPIAALLLMATLHWPQFLALFGLGAAAARWWPEPGPVPLPYAAAILTAAFLLNVIPYLEEMLRCIRRARQKSRQK